MLLTNKQRKIFTIIIAIASLALLLGSFLPFLTAFR